MKALNYLRLIDIGARMTLKAEASRFYLSFFWWILEPLFVVLGFYLVFNVLLARGQEDYLLFLLCAKVPYMWFSKAVTAASNSIIQQKGIIGQINIPKAIFPYSTIQVSLYKEAPVFILLLLACVFFGYHPNIDWLWLAPLIVLEYLIIVGTSLFAALLICYIEDVRMLINMGMMLLMFASGIFFDISELSPEMSYYLITFNPIAFLCDSFRKLLMNGHIYDLYHLGTLVIIFSGLIAIMHIFYNRLNYNLAARVINS